MIYKSQTHISHSEHTKHMLKLRHWGCIYLRRMTMPNYLK